jgi:hypothetical protein
VSLDDLLTRPCWCADTFWTDEKGVQNKLSIGPFDNHDAAVIEAQKRWPDKMFFVVRYGPLMRSDRTEKVDEYRPNEPKAVREKPKTQTGQLKLDIG